MLFFIVVLLPFIASPIKPRIGSAAFPGDWRPALLALGLLAADVVVLAIAPLRTLFDLAAPSIGDYALRGDSARRDHLPSL